MCIRCRWFARKAIPESKARTRDNCKKSQQGLKLGCSGLLGWPSSNLLRSGEERASETLPIRGMVAWNYDLVKKTECGSQFWNASLWPVDPVALGLWRCLSVSCLHHSVSWLQIQCQQLPQALAAVNSLLWWTVPLPWAEDNIFLKVSSCYSNERRNSYSNFEISQPSRFQTGCTHPEGTVTVVFNRQFFGEFLRAEIVMV